MNDIEEQEKRINKILEEIFKNHYDTYSIIIDNLSIFKNLFLLVEQSFKGTIKENKVEIDWNRIKSADYVEKMQILKEFYQSLNIDFDFEKLFADGTVDMITNEISIKESDEKVEENSCFYYRNHPYMDIHNNGLITDLRIWVHELSHYRNKMIGYESEARYWLTETLAFTSELIFLDYLKKHGDEYEAAIFKYNEMKNLHSSAYDCYYIIRMFNVYEKLGSINKENYLKIYDDQYEEDINGFLEAIKKLNVNHVIEYGIASALSFYLYSNYKKDNSYVEIIKKLNESIKTKSIIECLNLIGLYPQYEDDYIKNTTNLTKSQEERIEKDGVNHSFEKIQKGLNDYALEVEQELKMIDIKQRKM